MSDALLNQASTAELRAVVGHEIGHDVLHHALLEALLYSALLTGAFLIVHLLLTPVTNGIGRSVETRPTCIRWRTRKNRTAWPLPCCAPSTPARRIQRALAWKQSHTPA